VRVGQGIVPTPVAKRIYPDVKRALDGLRRAVGEARGFEPATSSRHFRICIPHPMGPIWALAIRAAARAAAPDVSLEFETRTLPIEVATRLRSGELDVCVDWFPVEGDRFVLRKLFEEHIFFAARPGHPRARPGMSADELRREQFVRIHYRTGPPPDAVRNARRGIEELDLDWALHVSEFLEIPYVVLQTDLLGFMLKSMMNPALNTANLQIIAEIPPAIGIPIYLVWHETRRADDGHRWLRDLVAATVCAAVAE
jgi:DNA-binding transcriptional LysR family regulator